MLFPRYFLFIIGLLGLGLPYFSLAAEPSAAISIYEVLQRISRFLLMIIIPLAVVGILWAAFNFITSAGAPEKTNKAKQILAYTFIGLAIALFSQGMVSIIGNILGIEILELRELEEQQVAEGTPTEAGMFGITPALGEGVSSPLKGEKFPPPPPEAEGTSFRFISQALAKEEIDNEMFPPPLTTAKYIVVIRPDGQTQIKRGETFIISWTSLGIEKVGIVLYKGTQLIGVIARNLPAENYLDPGISNFYWRISKNFETGDNYYIAIYEYPWEDEKFVAYSQRFIIAKEGKEKYLRLVSPQPNEEWQIGGTYPIKWEAKGVEKIDILFRPLFYESGWYDIENGGDVKMLEKEPILIISGLSVNSGEYKWLVPFYRYLNRHGYIMMIRDSSCNCGSSLNCPCSAKDENSYPFYIKGGTPCLGEGAISWDGRGVCCSGLKKIPVAVLDPESLRLNPNRTLHSREMVCTRCGDGICGLRENKWNCPDDCSQTYIKVLYPNKIEFFSPKFFPSDQELNIEIKWKASQDIKSVNIYLLEYHCYSGKVAPSWITEKHYFSKGRRCDVMTSLIARDIPASQGSYLLTEDNFPTSYSDYPQLPFFLTSKNFRKIRISDSSSDTFDISDNVFWIYNSVYPGTCFEGCKELGYPLRACMAIRGLMGWSPVREKTLKEAWEAIEERQRQREIEEFERKNPWFPGTIFYQDFFQPLKELVFPSIRAEDLGDVFGRHGPFDILINIGNTLKWSSEGKKYFERRGKKYLVGLSGPQFRSLTCGGHYCEYDKSGNIVGCRIPTILASNQVCVCRGGGEKFINVITPNRKSKWEAGKTYEISWNANEIKKVDISLYHPSLISYFLKENPNSSIIKKWISGANLDFLSGKTPLSEKIRDLIFQVALPIATNVDAHSGEAGKASNFGKYSWKVPSDFPPGDYLIIIKESNSPAFSVYERGYYSAFPYSNFGKSQRFTILNPGQEGSCLDKCQQMGYLKGICRVNVNSAYRQGIEEIFKSLGYVNIGPVPPDCQEEEGYQMSCWCGEKEKKPHPKLHYLLYQLTQAEDYIKFAKQYRGIIDIIDNKVRVIIELVNPEYELPINFGIEETRHKNNLQALVYIEKLLELAGDPNIKWIRPPMKPMPFYNFYKWFKEIWKKILP